MAFSSTNTTKTKRNETGQSNRTLNNPSRRKKYDQTDKLIEHKTELCTVRPQKAHMACDRPYPGY